MENFLVIGLNHKTSPIEVREKFFLNIPQSDLLLSELKNNPKICEAFVLSTCNRIEIYLISIDKSLMASFIYDLIAKIKKNAFDFDCSAYMYTFKGVDAIKHMFRVVTGLDSLILGEEQILGQFKDAVEHGRQMGTISTYFNILTNTAITAGKKARHETQISFGGASISWAAIEVAQQQLGGSLKDKKVLVIGAGKMGKVALKNLCARGLAKIYLMNRTGEKAETLARQHGAIAASFWDIKDILIDIDLCICSVGAPHYILDAEKITAIMPLRHHRPLVFIDISMPRNIDPQAAALPHVHLSSIDDLGRMVHGNLQKRLQAVAEVEGIIAKKMAAFDRKIERSRPRHVSNYFSPN